MTGLWLSRLTGCDDTFEDAAIKFQRLHHWIHDSSHRMKVRKFHIRTPYGIYTSVPVERDLCSMALGVPFTDQLPIFPKGGMILCAAHLF